MPLQTAPNSAMPAYRKRPACDEADAKGQAAGILFVAPDGDILLLRRSGAEANFAGHWALPGGGVEEGENPWQAAQREAEEEMGGPAGDSIFAAGFTGKKARVLDQRRTPNDFVFTTFTVPAEEKFVPRLNSEHAGYVWTPMDQLPEPMHPAVKATLQERIGAGAQDMSPEDWQGLRDGFVKWTIEEEDEPEHATDKIEERIARLAERRGDIASDSALRLALDRGTVREKSPEGHLHVVKTPISKATVNPYRGSEIPGAEEMGLDPDRIYYLLRDPDELAKAAATFNGKPLLCKHVPVSAEDHATEEVCGSTGTEAVFEDPYLLNSLVIWTQDAIDEVENDSKKELSSGYRYRADMTPGIFRGMRFDGVMRDIVGNHVALVKDGRAGPDVVVGDSMENLMAKPTRIAALALRTVARGLVPVMAMDAKLPKLMPLFGDLTTKNFSAKKPAIMTALKSVPLAKDASIEGVVELLDLLENRNATDADEPAEEADLKKIERIEAGEEDFGMAKPASSTEPDFAKDTDHEKLRGFLKDCGMDDGNIETAMGMLPQMSAGQDEDLSDEDKAKKKAEEDAKKKAAEDAANEDDEKKEKTVDKKAMDQAINSAVLTERKTQQDIRTALNEVRPFVGDLSMAFDTAGGVYRQAAKMLGIDGAETIHESALPTIIKMQRKAGAQPTERPIAMDAAQISDFSKRFPGADRIRNA